MSRPKHIKKRFRSWVFTDPERTERLVREKLLRAGGRELLGDKGLSCIACHNFNGKAVLVNQGIDLLTSYQRLEPGWFNSYLRNPGAFSPRTVMPTAWPNGVASLVCQRAISADAKPQTLMLNLADFKDGNGATLQSWRQLNQLGLCARFEELDRGQQPQPVPWDGEPPQFHRVEWHVADKPSLPASRN